MRHEELETLKKLLVTFVKIGISLGILAYLVRDAQKHEVFGDLLRQPKDWPVLGLAVVACFCAVLLTLVRWCYLVRALDLPFRLGEALRLGFLGYLFNLAPMGIMGGDLLKAFLLARQQREHQARAVASVAVDRLIGLYMLFVVASVAILATRFWDSPYATIQMTCKAVLCVTAVSTAMIVYVLLPGIDHKVLRRHLVRIPYVGPAIWRLVDAVWMYRRNRSVLFVSAAMSVGVHALFTVGVFLIASGLYDAVPTLGMHFIFSPLSAATGIVPLPVGPFEYALDRLYVHAPMPGGEAMKPGQGLMVALGYRLATVLIAAVGICYYLASRQEVSTVLEETATGPQAGIGSKDQRRPEPEHVS
ncbi:MAG TPA: flippase-like domain-containing protein [Planctomycetaceae bacterium]|nr:flippase-like domain-containing protein [Planctomycetaceae bacterium]HIQ23131.1 flippase-like domain-containing protein [Planctomycetota bacterium]